MNFMQQSIWIIFSNSTITEMQITKNDSKSETKGKSFLSPPMITGRYLYRLGIELIKSLRLYRIPTLIVPITVPGLPLTALYLGLLDYLLAVEIWKFFVVYDWWVQA